MVKDTKFESKSQPQEAHENAVKHCFYWSKIQNLKANHNKSSVAEKFVLIAFIGQRYKIWKQITTSPALIGNYELLLLLVKDTKFESKSQPKDLFFGLLPYCFYWSKIQNLKANHNAWRSLDAIARIAFIGQRYKIWKQITTHNNREYDIEILLLLVKDTKFESKSQRRLTFKDDEDYCFYWSKIQNLKANHN